MSIMVEKLNLILLFVQAGQVHVLHKLHILAKTCGVKFIEDIAQEACSHHSYLEIQVIPWQYGIP